MFLWCEVCNLSSLCTSHTHTKKGEQQIPEKKTIEMMCIWSTVQDQNEMKKEWKEKKKTVTIQSRFLVFVVVISAIERANNWIWLWFVIVSYISVQLMTMNHWENWKIVSFFILEYFFLIFFRMSSSVPWWNWLWFFYLQICVDPLSLYRS